MPPNNYKMTNGSLKNHFIPKIQSIQFFFCQGQMRTFTIPIHHRESLHSFIHWQQKLEVQMNSSLEQRRMKY
jgi:hypothetical protein